MNKKKKWIITAIILAVFCAALGIYNYYANRSTNEEEVTRTVSPRSKNILNVNGVIIRPQPLTDGITTVGNLLPDEEVDLSFETSGKIVAINFQEGAAVRKGELLAKGERQTAAGPALALRSPAQTRRRPRLPPERPARKGRREPGGLRTGPHRAGPCSTPI